jgi:hypothetical protein
MKMTILFCLIILNFNHALGQSDEEEMDVPDDLTSQESSTTENSANSTTQTVQAPFNPTAYSEQRPNLVQEKIQRISNNQSIFIVTNSQQSFSKGDFISLIMNDKLTARALVAKDVNGVSGIKILKIYEQNEWQRLRDGVNVFILRGDDSFYRKAMAQASPDATPIALMGEDDVFDPAKIEGEIDLEENDKRSLKNDHLLGVSYHFTDVTNSSGSNDRYGQIYGHWAYQVKDNFFLEVGFGRFLVRDYPASSKDTAVNNFTLKAKYTFVAPFETFLQPSIGFQILDASSPGAGKIQEGQTDSEETRAELKREVELVDSLEKKRLTLGVTALKRLVPGWYLRVDLGLDGYGFGLNLEF